MEKVLNINEKYYWGFFFIVSALLIFFEVLIYKSFNISVFLILFINLSLIIFTIYIIYIKDLPTFLLFINIIPLLYFNDEFHYNLTWILIQDIFIFAIIFIALLKLFDRVQYDKFNSSFKVPIILMFSYFMLSAINGYLHGYKILEIINELYHYFYYLLALIIGFVIDKRKNYLLLFLAISLIVTLISIEYMVVFVTNNFFRVATFQSNLILLIIAIVFSFLLFTKKYKFLLLAILTINIVGLIIVQSRSLWVSALLVLFIILFYYLTGSKKSLLGRLILYGFMLLIPAILFSGKFIGRGVSHLNGKEQLEQRAQSISNPGKDTSFLMRFELDYYAVREFLKTPIWGTGLGSFVKYKILQESHAKIYYLDSTWVYVLWKGGIIGFILFAWVFVMLLKGAWFIYRNSNEIKIKILGLGIFAAFIGFIVSSFFSANLIKYKYGVIIAIVISFVDFEKRNLLKLVDSKA